MTCEHLNFQANVKVTRLTDNENENVVTGYSADMKICCVDCGIPFEFIGVPGGYSPIQPMVSFDATELRVPIKPSSDPVEQTKVILKSKHK
jgi:hypothetical protein